MLDGDKASLDKIAAPELSYGHSSGMIENKEQFVNEFVQGNSIFTDIRLENQTIEIAGDNAIVRHRLIGDTFNKKTPGKADIIILMVWHKRDGEWKLLARQAAKIPPEYMKKS